MPSSSASSPPAPNVEPAAGAYFVIMSSRRADKLFMEADGVWEGGLLRRRRIRGGVVLAPDGGAVLVGDGRRLWYASRDSKVVTHVLATQFRAFSVVALAKGYTGLDKLKHRR